MNAKWVTAFLLAAGILYSHSSFAGGWGSREELTNVYPSTGVNGIYVAQSTMTNPDQCGRQDFYVLEKAHALFDEIYAMVLAARVSDKPIQFHVAGCVNQRPVITLAQL